MYRKGVQKLSISSHQDRIAVPSHDSLEYIFIAQKKILSSKVIQFCHQNDLDKPILHYFASLHLYLWLLS